MYYRDLFGKTRKTVPADADSVNAKLLIRGGFIDPLMAGVYSWLPLGLRVLKNVENIIRQEMDALGAQEVLLPALHPKELWEETGRWKTMDVLFKIKSQTGKEYALGPTHEEVITPLAKKFIQSYKDLPVKLYQIQTKFRDELRAKAGVLRGKEFGMKDLYTFHRNEEDLKAFYPQAVKSYLEIFDRCGLKAYMTTASGGSFSAGYSDEFQVPSPSGEDMVIFCQNCETRGDDVAYNPEVLGDAWACIFCGRDLKGQKELKSIEVGNTFKLGTKFSDVFNLEYLDERGERRRAVMGCFGIGTTRIVGSIVEVNHDEKGIIWPKSVAPFDAHLISLAGKSADRRAVAEASDDLYGELKRLGQDVLYDDREDVSAGEKFSDADLIGIPVRLVVSSKTLAEDSVEYKERRSKETELVKIKKISEKF